MKLKGSFKKSLLVSATTGFIEKTMFDILGEIVNFLERLVIDKANKQTRKIKSNDSDLKCLFLLDLCKLAPSFTP